MTRLLLALLLCSCATSIEVLKVATPQEAAQANKTKLHAVAVLRGKARAALPDGVTIEHQEVSVPTARSMTLAGKGGGAARYQVLVPRPGIFTYALDPDETVVRDDQKRIIGVKSGEHVTKFIAATAEIEGTEIKGELEGHAEHVPLLPSDRVELRGMFAPGESVPTGGTIGITRAWSAIAFGGALLGGAWLPSVIVAATSPVAANHWLYLPGIGPWIDYATRDACPPSVDPSQCLTDGKERVALIADGIIQSTGAVLLIVGIPSSAEVRWGKQARLRLSPVFAGRAGVSIEGTF